MSDERREPGDLLGRRDALLVGGWLAIGATVLGGTASFVRLLFRRAPVVNPTVFAAGPAASYAIDSVSDRYLSEWRVFIVRQDDRIFALEARCSHLGCTPRWHAMDQKFRCPCHGSGFHASGVNFEGPAPTPLDRVRVWINASGTLMVDTGARFPSTEWDAPGASVQLPETHA